MIDYTLKVRSGHTPLQTEGITRIESCTWFDFKFTDPETNQLYMHKHYLKHSTIKDRGMSILVAEMFDLLADQTLLEFW